MIKLFFPPIKFLKKAAPNGWAEARMAREENQDGTSLLLSTFSWGAAGHSGALRWMFSKPSKKPPSQFPLLGSWFKFEDCCDKVPPTGSLEQKCISALEAGSPPSKGVSRAISFKGAREGLSQLSLSPSFCLWENSFHLHTTFSLCACLSLCPNFPFFVRTPVTLDQGPP